MRTLLLTLTLAATAAVSAPALAAADTSTSGNWSGYAAHGKGAKFRYVTADWRQPAGACTPGRRTYSAFWVGIGGYALNSQALEQIGTELDCTAAGKSRLSAWYELVPAPSRNVALTIHSGDALTASVSLAGSKVTLTLSDRTRHRTFKKTIVDHTLDITSAEWIAEAPSECTSDTSCKTLPLADFGTVDFTGARATTVRAQRSGITSRHWDTTKIVLGSGGPRYVSTAAADDFEASPSALSAGGGAFSVAFATPSATAPTTATTPAGSPGSDQPGTAGSGSGWGYSGRVNSR